VQLEPVLSAAWRPAALRDSQTDSSEAVLSTSPLLSFVTGTRYHSYSSLYSMGYGNLFKPTTQFIQITFNAGSNKIYFWSLATGVSYAEIPASQASSTPSLTGENLLT